MGRHGPPPEPVEAKRARGITAPSRVNYESPRPRDRKPVAPKDMAPEARKVWNQVLREMPPGVILRVDGIALRCYAEAVVERARVKAMVIETQPLIRQPGGRWAKNPLYQVLRDQEDMVKGWAAQLGLTPAARASLRLDAGAPGAGIAAELGLPPRLRVVGD